MRLLLYLRFILLTAGTLLPFFWMVVILGHRRQRNFERAFFFLCLALTLFFGSSLLALNAQWYYGTPPAGLLRFAWTFLCLGLWFIPSLVVHLHIEYATLRGLLESAQRKFTWLAMAYLPAAILLWKLFAALRISSGFNFERPTHIFGIAFQIWFVLALTLAAYWERRFYGVAPDREQKSFHRVTTEVLSLFAGLFLLMIIGERVWPSASGTGLSPLLYLLGLIPLATLIGSVQRFNFLQIGRQRNLIYAVFMVFVALLYLSLVRRVSLWLESYLPPEATAAILLFLPVVFFEPLQRLMRRLLRQTAQSEVDRAQRLMAPINEIARLGDLEKLREFAQRWIAEQLQLAGVKLELAVPSTASGYAVVAKSSSEVVFQIAGDGHWLGRLRVRPHGAMVSGETYAALEFLAEQLPAAFHLCRLIEEKLQLERELAERERLALVGQMAASISHNLKNPLGSMKTILQVQMESPELPPSMRHETQMVLDEINRLSARLNQLLQFSRPAVLGQKSKDTCDIREVITEVLTVLRPEAERRHVRLGWRMAEGESKVHASAEALHDVISNLVVNAIDASPPEGQVKVELAWLGLPCVVSVEDEGKGIPSEMQETVLRPFFTTKANGTGLGLAIVVKRVAELGGELKIVSPMKGGRGTKFEVKIWPASMRRGNARSETKVQEL